MVVNSAARGFIKHNPYMTTEPSQQNFKVQPMQKTYALEVLDHQLYISQLIFSKKKSKGLICFDPSLQSANTQVSKTKMKCQ